MGKLYRARDSKLGRAEAMEDLPEAFSDDPQRLARFDREARLLASFYQPNIAAIYRRAASGGIRYLVMELVPGQTLAEWMSYEDNFLDYAEETFIYRIHGHELWKACTTMVSLLPFACSSPRIQDSRAGYIGMRKDG